MTRLVRSSTAWGVLLIAALAAPPMRNALEVTMFLHMLVQIPLLILAGVLLACGLPQRTKSRLQSLNDFGLPGITLALAVSSLWMIPRALDVVLADPFAEAVKFASLPLAVGLPLALSWPRLHFIAKGFVLANWIPMLPVLGWLYRESPTRLCNYYLVNDQIIVGNTLMGAGIGLAAFWLLSLFRAGSSKM